MLLLRSLRARLLIIGIVPVFAALAVTAVMTVRSINQFSEQQRAQAQAQQLKEMKRLTTGLSREYSILLSGAFLGRSNDVLRSMYLEAASDSALFFVPTAKSKVLNAESLDLSELQWTQPLPPALTDQLKAGQAVQIPLPYLPAVLAGEVVVARGLFPTEQADFLGASPGLLVAARPTVQVASPVGTLRRALVPAFAIGTAVAVALALALGLRLVRPLRRLAAAARAVARGDDDVPLDTTRADEIGMVNRAFSDMTVRLTEARDTERLFLMRVSHELRTPLTAIRGQVDALADGIFDDEDSRQTAYEAITAESLRLNRLVGDLLDLARLQAKRFGLEADEVDLNILLEQVVTGQGGEARDRDIAVGLQSGVLPVVIGDGDRILQIVSNLVRNAVRWTPDGGTITVSALAEAGRVWITVDDSGPGVPVEKRAAIFRAFYTEDGTGTGLGLAIARELSVAMGGSVAVGDSPHGGARFVVELPCIRARSERVSATSR
ncbi:MAG: HAMP domain-containing histidine kinase [Thermoleophilia bacterium]|nr:HAMP domain-containing histidine kinase [Thermoleophilia bacterium]